MTFIRRFVKFFAFVCGVCMLFVSPLIAEAKPVTVDDVMTISASDEANDNAAKNAMDSDPMTRWETSHGTDPAWLEIVLKKEHTISSISIMWEQASARVYDIQVSEDGQDWKNVAAVNDGVEAEERIIEFSPVRTRYVRIYCKERNGKWGYSIWEVIFNPPDESQLPVLNVDNLPYMNPHLPVKDRVEDLLKYMTLKEKIDELAGKDNMDGKTNRRLGIPPLLMADGPHGIRKFGEATCFPGLITCASWDEDLMRRVGVAIAREARAKGRNLVLGPCINIHRTPLGGRNFESFSEDPYLTGRMAVAYVKGVQSEKIGTAVKHFACNNQEWERDSISVEISERALREIYLPGFKAAVCEGNATSVMGAYNKVNGEYCCANYHLLTDILKNEWGFKGFVVSDWGAIHDTLKDANAGSDMEMGGPGNYFTRAKLLPAVQNGLIPESAIDDKVRRILYVKFYLGLFDGIEKKYQGAANTKEHQELVREIAENGVVLLKNENEILPLNIEKIKSIAVIGPNAKKTPIDGGGSSEVISPYSISALKGLQNKCENKVVIKYAKGCDIPFDWKELTVEGKAPDNAEKVRVKCLSEDMAPGKGLSFVWLDNGSFKVSSLEGEELLKNQSFETGDANWEKSGNAKYIFPQDWHYYDGRYSYGIGNDGGPENASGEISQIIEIPGKVKKGDLLTFQMWIKPEKYYSGKVSLKLEFLSSDNKLLSSYQSKIMRNQSKMDKNLLKEAVNISKTSDLVIIFVGLNKYQESEGFDRENMQLPDGQDELIEAVSAINKNTIVVLINGTPVNMERWVDKVPAVIEAWYPGQEGGNAIANILFGDVNPSGKLSVTFPRKLSDNPSYGNYPGGGGKVYYKEGIFVGYRHYDKNNIEPRFPFGHGLSYSKFEYSNLVISPKQTKDGDVIVRLDIKNISNREGREVVQLYVNDKQSSLERPPQELKAFKKVSLKPAEKKTVEMKLNKESLSFYHPEKKGWVAEPGEFEILIGSSSRDIRLRDSFTLTD